ncbi:MAG TPA: acetolactate synthase large subunit [Thermoanaerobaculia bacterium]|nr:acetolactate synthase large subunit [Thermoanaerobaculia bacterium]
MNGAESLVRAAREAGIEVCFSNPGTSEMPLVAALDSEPGVRGVLVLFEGVASGAADGYGRMAEKPAMTLFHLGPGHGNAIANLHNARRGRSPLVNLVGDHATWHRRYDPPLASDIKSLARPVSDWYKECRSAATVGRDLRRAIATAWTKPGRLATLTVPTDCQWGDAGSPRFRRLRVPDPSPVAGDAIEAASRALRGEGRSLLLLGAYGVRRRGLLAAGRIGAATGCRLGLETFPTRLERGPDLPILERVPYFPEQARDFFAGLSTVVLAGAVDPVAFFGYPSGISRLVPEDVGVTVLARPEEDVERALDDLAASLDAPATFAAHGTPRPEPPAPGPITASSLAQAIAAAQPENAVVVDEGITSSGAYLPLTAGCPPSTYLALTGGAIGWGLPCGTGAALGAPGRKVIVLEGDGSGLYTVQSLWTQAREGLDVVNVVFVNDLYRILQIELHRAGIERPGPQGQALTDLAAPPIEWASVAKGFGVPWTRVETADGLHAAMTRAVAEPGPALIEVRVPGASRPGVP